MTPEDEERLVSQTARACIGKERIVRFLQSSTGLLLNDKRCTVLNVMPNGRLGVKMHHDQSEHGMKPQNLMDPAWWPFGSYQPHVGPLIHEEEVRRHLRDAVEHEDPNLVLDRKDIAKRVAVAGDVIRGGSTPIIRCCDPMIPAEEYDPVTRLIQRVRFCCCSDGSVDFRRFNAGLVHPGAGDCTICLESMGGERPLGLPCGHSFHMRCCKEWLSKHDTCPSCRFDLGQPGVEYLKMFESYEERVAVRVREWLISGMCERCQAVLHESNPLVFAQTEDGARLMTRRAVS